MFFDGAHGWNIDIDAQSSVLNQVRQSLFTTVGWKGLVRMKRICTLLGPEGPEQPGLPGWTFPLDLFRSTVALFEPLVVRGTARTLRTTQWTRAS